jgi:hypothetical protein
MRARPSTLETEAETLRQAMEGHGEALAEAEAAGSRRQ